MPGKQRAGAGRRAMKGFAPSTNALWCKVSIQRTIDASFHVAAWPGEFCAHDRLIVVQAMRGAGQGQQSGLPAVQPVAKSRVLGIDRTRMVVGYDVVHRGQILHAGIGPGRCRRRGGQKQNAPKSDPNGLPNWVTCHRALCMVRRGSLLTPALARGRLRDFISWGQA